jgi:hypothetical protein
VSIAYRIANLYAQAGDEAQSFAWLEKSLAIPLQKWPRIADYEAFAAWRGDGGIANSPGSHPNDPSLVRKSGGPRVLDPDGSRAPKQPRPDQLQERGDRGSDLRAGSGSNVCESARQPAAKPLARQGAGLRPMRTPRRRGIGTRRARNSLMPTVRTPERRTARISARRRARISRAGAPAAARPSEGPPGREAAAAASIYLRRKTAARRAS